MTDLDTIRTEEEFDTQVAALTASVEKMGDTAEERLAELIHLCVEERVHEPLIQTIFDRTHKRVAVIGTVRVPFGYCKSNRERTYVSDPAPSNERLQRVAQLRDLLERRLNAREVPRDHW